MLAASVAHAGVSVRGTAEAIRIETEKASIEEVLGALRDAYGLTFASKIPLGKQVSGTYDGPLSKVVALLLRDMNFVLTHEGKTLHVAIISTRGRQETIGAAVPPPATAGKSKSGPHFPF